MFGRKMITMDDTGKFTMADTQGSGVDTGPDRNDVKIEDYGVYIRHLEDHVRFQAGIIIDVNKKLDLILDILGIATVADRLP